jgi:hypothetical protein
MEKIFNQKSFKYLVWTPLGGRVNIYVDKFFLSNSLSGVSRLILFPLFANSKFSPGFVDTSGN